MLLLDEYFHSEDPRFLDQLRQVHFPRKLAGLAERWKKDPRPWAREQILAYLAMPPDCLGHEPIVKRLFKHAEHQGDDEVIGAFLVAFDRLVRRRRTRRRHYDWKARKLREEEILVTPRDRVHVRAGRVAQNPKTLARIEVPGRVVRGGALFSYHTRYYLRRRAWRYFRRMGYQRPDDYCAALAAALARYTDEDFARGETILDNWSLLHACFRRHDALEFDRAKVILREGRGVGELTPAPRFLKLWRRPGAAGVLLRLATSAGARFVRLWAMNLLRQEHKAGLAELGPKEILPLLLHADAEIQQFGAELLQSARGLASLELSVWMDLLKTTDPTALAAICEAMARLVSPQRLGLDRCVDLACAAPVPVARMGLTFLQQRWSESGGQAKLLARLAEARCAAVAAEVTRFALARIAVAETYDRDVAAAFFDSLLPEMRAAAWEWLTPECPAWSDPALWCKLLETPFDDVRARLIDCLQRRADLPGTPPEALEPLWCSVLVGVHRGGRQKPKAVAQIARAIRKKPELAESLLPVLVLSVRSVRAPERRAGLAAVVGLARDCPAVRDRLAGAIPELALPAEAPAP